MNILFISVLLTINISIFLISFLLKSPEPTLSYYITCIWLSILCSVNWILSSLVFVSKKDNKKTETGSFFFNFTFNKHIFFCVFMCKLCFGFNFLFKYIKSNTPKLASISSRINYINNFIYWICSHWKSKLNS